MNALKVATPCPARWEDMAGDEKARFCRQCQKHVYNFSAMTTMEVEQLVLKNEGNLCMRLYRRMDGTVLTADCPTGRAIVQRKRFQWVGGLAAAIVLLLSTVWAKAGARNVAGDGKVMTMLKHQWYDLQVRLGLIHYGPTMGTPTPIPATVPPTSVGTMLPPAPAGQPSP